MVGIRLTDEFVDDIDFYPARRRLSVGGGYLSPGGNAALRTGPARHGRRRLVARPPRTRRLRFGGPFPATTDGLPRNGDSCESAAPLERSWRRSTIRSDFTSAGCRTCRNGAVHDESYAAWPGRRTRRPSRCPKSPICRTSSGLSYASQYATSIRNDQPQIFTLDGQDGAHAEDRVSGTRHGRAARHHSAGAIVRCNPALVLSTAILLP